MVTGVGRTHHHQPKVDTYTMDPGHARDRSRRAKDHARGQLVGNRRDGDLERGHVRSASTLDVVGENLEEISGAVARLGCRSCRTQRETCVYIGSLLTDQF